MSFMKNSIYSNVDSNKSSSDSVVTIHTKLYIISIPNDINQNVTFLRLMN